MLRPGQRVGLRCGHLKRSSGRQIVVVKVRTNESGAGRVGFSSGRGQPVRPRTHAAVPPTSVTSPASSPMSSLGVWFGNSFSSKRQKETKKQRIRFPFFQGSGVLGGRDAGMPRARGAVPLKRTLLVPPRRPRSELLIGTDLPADDHALAVASLGRGRRACSRW